jgi:hypothetical protein
MAGFLWVVISLNLVANALSQAAIAYQRLVLSLTERQTINSLLSAVP